VAVVAFR